MHVISCFVLRWRIQSFKELLVTIRAKRFIWDFERIPFSFSENANNCVILLSNILIKSHSFKSDILYLLKATMGFSKICTRRHLQYKNVYTDFVQNFIQASLTNLFQFTHLFEEIKIMKATFWASFMK